MKTQFPTKDAGLTRKDKSLLLCKRVTRVKAQFSYDLYYLSCMQVFEFKYKTVILFLRVFFFFSFCTSRQTVLTKKPTLKSLFTLAAVVQGLHIGFSNGFALFPRGVGRTDKKSKQKFSRQMSKFLLSEQRNRNISM